MNRILRLAVAIVIPLSFAAASHAQSPSTYYGVDTASPVYGGQPYCGFGLQYSPAVPAGGVIVDQYGLVHQVPYVASAPQVVVQARPRVVGRYGSRRAMAQSRYVVQTGSLCGLW
jgi:hypothetical protein